LRVSVVSACFEFFQSRRGGRRGAARSPWGAESSPSRPSRRRGRRGRRARTPWTRAWRSPAVGARSSWSPWRLARGSNASRLLEDRPRRAPDTPRGRRDEASVSTLAGLRCTNRGVDVGACVPGSMRAGCFARATRPTPRARGRAVSPTFKPISNDTRKNRATDHARDSFVSVEEASKRRWH